MKAIRKLLFFISVMSVLVVSSCEPDAQEDTTAPAVRARVASVDVTGGSAVGIEDGGMTIGGTKVAEWSDETTPLSALKVSVTDQSGQTVSSGSILSDEGTLKISVTDQSGNQGSATISLTVVKDLTAPEVKVAAAEINIGSGALASISDGVLEIDDTEVASWSDDMTPAADLKVEVRLNGKEVKSGDALSEAGTLTFAVTDQNGNKGGGSIAILMDATAPAVIVIVPELNIGSGAAISVSEAVLSVGETEVASWSDDMTPVSELKVELTINDRTVKNGDMLSEAGTLTIAVTDQNGNIGEGSVSILMDTTAPDVNVTVPEINVGGGMTVSIGESSLTIGNTDVASWSDDMTPAADLKVAVTFNKKAVRSGDILSEAGTLNIAVTDQNGNVGEGTVNIIRVLVYGLDKLRSLDLQVDREVNLLQGVSYAAGVTLDKVEVSYGGVRETVADPSRFTPEYPGSCDIFLVLKLANGSTAEEPVTGLTIKPLEASSLALREMDLLTEEYAWTEVFLDKKIEFIYGHLLTSYVNRQWFRQDITYILMGEMSTRYDIENIGDNNPAWATSHADEGYFHIITMTPDAKVKACGGTWEEAEKYVKSHQDEKLMISCAADCLGGDDRETFFSDLNYYSLKNILSYSNCIVSTAGGNKKTIKYTLEESHAEMQYGQYTSASVSSNLNNKVTVCGYDPTIDNIFGVDEDSRRPIGFGRDKVNIVIPFMQLVKPNGPEYTNTTSSYPTGTLSSALGNYLSILIHNNPDWTLNDAMTKMLDKYLYEEPLKYLNDDGQVVNGDNWNFFRCTEFLEDQTLRKDDFNAVQLSGDTVHLPSGKGVVYLGKGVQFEYNGTYYDSTEGNESLLAAALTAGGGVIRQRWSRERWLKMGGGGSAQLEVRLVNSACEIIPDIKLSRSVAVEGLQ